MSSTDELLANAARYAAAFDKAGLPTPPARKVAVVACMDSRLNVFALLGLAEGDAHVIRNAGGLITDDQIRSLALSQRLLGTEEIILIHHTECGMQSVPDEEFRRQLLDDTGIEPPWAVESSDDLDANVRMSMARIVASPFIPVTSKMRGFIYDVRDGTLREVTPH
ncbi:MAG: carbonic anhydrase [Acidimicrobiales bacterium]|jgi:carbonic anhydrase